MCRQWNKVKCMFNKDAKTCAGEKTVSSSTGLGKLISMCKKEEEIRSVPITLHKKPNSDQRPKCGTLTTKTTRIDVGSTYIRGVGKDFLSRTPSVPELRPTAESWDFRKLKLLHS